jgi:outer membrane protein TolC
MALLATARVKMHRAEAERDLGVHALAALIAQGPNIYVTIAPPHPFVENALPMPSHFPADLIARRSDILAAQARIQAALHGRAAARAEFYPNIDFAAASGLQAISLGGLFTGEALAASVGPAIHLPVFDAGRLRAICPRDRRSFGRSCRI